MAESRKRKLGKPSHIETRELIRLIQERPCLWDRNLPDYRQRPEKEKAWSEIYRIVDPDYDDYSEEMRSWVGTQITKRWYNVRDAYVKSKKHNVRYIYTENLAFLNSALNPDDPVYNYEESKRDDKNYENIEEHWLNDALVVEDDSNAQNKNENIVTLLADLIKREEDDDQAFFKSVIPMVKSLSDDSKFEFRMQVMSLLKSLKNKEKKRVIKKELQDSESDDD